MSRLAEYFSFTRRNSFSLLLISLLIFLLVPAFFEQTGFERIIRHAALTLVIVTCLWVIFGKVVHRIQPIITGVIVVGLNWMAYTFESNASALGAKIAVLLVFWIFTTYYIFKRINTMKVVDTNVIAGALSGYLLFGFLGGLMARWLELVSPGSYNSAADADLGSFVYYSFVTLSTLGYGDILPVSKMAQNLAVAITLSGQIYLAIVIAILIGKFSAQSD